MRKLNVSKIWISAFLLAFLAAGCGDSDKGGGPSSPLTAPTVVSVTPTNGLTLLCPNIAVISATFSKQMNPATINTSTFTLTDPTGANVAGTVSLDSTGLVATLLPPAASLTPSTTFTATVTTGAADTFGNHLATNSVATFTTSAPCLLPPPSGLASACTFGILAATPVVSNVIGVTPPGPTHVTGDVGIWPAASVTGFPPGTMTGNGGLPHAGDAVAMAAQGDAQTAFTNAMNAGGGPSVGIAILADIGGETKPPGIYIAPTSLGITGDLTLDGSTNPNGVWIFKVPAALTTAPGSLPSPASRVLLVNAQPHNVFWVVGSSATLGTFSLMQGTILAQASVTLGTGATLDGRALALTGKIALDNNPVNVPPCP
jgi:Ice-binding-like/Bacterial Ig-like domain